MITPLVQVDVPDLAAVVRLDWGIGSLAFGPERAIVFEGGPTQLHVLKIELARELHGNRRFQLKMNPSQGTLELATSLPGRMVSSYIVGTLPELTDEFQNAVGKANERLALWTGYC